MAGAAIWRGTGQEWSALWVAISNNCACEFDDMTGAERSICAAHMMLMDQHDLDDLLGAYRSRDWFVRNEHSAHSTPNRRSRDA